MHLCCLLSELCQSRSSVLSQSGCCFVHLPWYLFTEFWALGPLSTGQQTLDMKPVPFTLAQSVSIGFQTLIYLVFQVWAHKHHRVLLGHCKKIWSKSLSSAVNCPSNKLDGNSNKQLDASKLGSIVFLPANSWINWICFYIQLDLLVHHN